jgi:hypothetical protein
METDARHTSHPLASAHPVVPSDSAASGVPISATAPLPVPAAPPPRRAAVGRSPPRGSGADRAGPSIIEPPTVRPCAPLCPTANEAAYSLPCGHWAVPAGQ